MNLKNEAGLGLLELLVSVLIAGFLSLLLAYTTTNTVRTYLNIRSAKRKLSARLKTYQFVDLAVRDLDSHPFRLPARVHNSGNFTYTNGKKLNHNSIGNNSVGFTSIRLSLPQTLRLEHLGGQNFNGCYLNPSSESLDRNQTRNALLLTTNGIFEAALTFNSRRTNSCYQINLVGIQNSMVTAGIDLDQIDYAHLAIPIRWIQTFFYDKGENYRIFRHVGEKIILNQPVLKQALPFSLQIMDSKIKGFYQYKVTMDKQPSIVLENLITRTHFKNVLNNL